MQQTKINQKAARRYAAQYGWHEITSKNGMISFGKDGMRINVFLTTGTVATCLNHPTKGKTQLFRRGISNYTLERIFRYPRVHTEKGYYTRDQYQSIRSKKILGKLST